MATFFRAAELSYFLRGPKISILHANTKDETPQPIYNKYPKWLAMHFSDLLRDCFPDEHEAHVPRKGCIGTDTVTVYGGVKPVHLMVFRWMLACCKGTGVAKIDWLPFAKYIRILEAAEILHVEPVQDDIIGDAVFERRLRNFWAYKVFKSECTEYEEDIYEYLRGRRKEVYEEQKREMGSGDGSQAYGQTSTKVTATAFAVAAPGREAGAVGVGASEQVASKTISAVVICKAQRGRPGYAKIQLSDLGILNTQLNGHRQTSAMV